MNRIKVVDDFVSSCYKNLPLAKSILQKHPGIRNCQLYENEPILFRFMWENEIEILRFLLENGFDPNVRHPRLKFTPLFCKSHSENIQIGELLLSFGADMYIESNRCNSALLGLFLCPFFKAAENGNLAFIELLLRFGFDPNYRDEHGRTIDDYLPDDNEQRKKINDLVKKYELTTKVKPKEGTKLPNLTFFETSLAAFEFYCLNDDFLEAKKILGRAPFLLNAYNYEHPIINDIVMRSDENALKFLLKEGFNPNLRDLSLSKWPPLIWAITQNKPQLVKLLLEYGADTNVEFDNISNLNSFACPFFIATFLGRIEMMEIFIENGFKLNYIDKNGKTVLDFLPPEDDDRFFRPDVEKGSREKVLQFLSKLK
jgi:ankyrin repeat protein